MQVFFLSLIAPLGSPIVAFFYGTWAPWTRIPCKIIYLFFILNFTYSYVSWRPIVAFLMELELHELEFHANIYIYIYIIILSLITPYSISTNQVLHWNSILRKSSYIRGVFP